MQTVFNVRILANAPGSTMGQTPMLILAKQIMAGKASVAAKRAVDQIRLPRNWNKMTVEVTR